MKRLGGTDALFLSMETPSWHQHVGGLTILDPGDSPLTYEDVIAKVTERIPFAPKFRWVLKEVPLQLDRPVWIDDPGFDVRRHVHRIGVPSPGGAKEVGELAGMLLSNQLDRRRPLWELWFVDGLADGKVALVMKYHHCLLDGMAGASLATVLMDIEPDPAPGTSLVAPPTPEEASAGPEPSNLGLLAETFRPDLARPVGLARYAVGMAAKGLAAIDSVRRDDENRSLMRAPRTPFNAPIGPRRELAFASVSMDDVRGLKDAHGVKVNDIVLALCAGALRTYLAGKDALPDVPLVVGVPVSTRAEGDGALDNQVTNMFVSLAANIADPIERLAAIHRSTQSAKAMQKAISARQIQSIGEVAAPLILGTAIRAVYRTGAMSRSPMRINTMVSNVPGPPIPLYFCGAKVTGVFPSSVIVENMGLNITVFSYLDRIDFGLHVDPDLVPDVWDVADALPVALTELLTASGLGDPTPVEQPFAPAIEVLDLVAGDLEAVAS